MGKYDAQTKWATVHTTRVVMNLNKNTDADILRYLDSVPSKQALRAFIVSVTNSDDEK